MEHDHLNKFPILLWQKNLAKIGPVVSDETAFKNFMIPYLYIAQEHGDNPHDIKF